MIRKAESAKIQQMRPKDDLVYTFVFFCFWVALFYAFSFL